MKRLLALVLTVSALSTSCRKIVYDETNNSTTNESTILEGKITANRTLKSGLTYKLRGLVYVSNNAILTIEPGTKIVGELYKNGGLIICRGSKIIADGSANSPIIFTSEAAIPQRGDWAGVVILGNAPTNASFNGEEGVGEMEGGINNAEGLGLYGKGLASNVADNSGILRYVRIEYAGYAFLPDKEINGLTLAGVGNQTIIDYVQVSFSNDDSFEWFGGTVNCKHLISYRALDDDFDTDNGFSGTVQFAIALRDSAIADISKSETFESDNDANGSDRKTIFTPTSSLIVPSRTSAVFSNVTAVGPKATPNTITNSLFLAGAQIRRNSEISIVNSVFIGWSGGNLKSLLIDGSKGIPTDLNLNPNGGLNFRNNIMVGTTSNAVSYAPSSTMPTGATTASILNWVYTSTYGNSIVPENADVNLIAPFNYVNPDFNPISSSSLAASGSSYLGAKFSELTPVSYRGACNVSDFWWKTWTKYSHQ